MSLLTLVLIALSALFLGAVGYFLWVVKISSTPTKGGWIDLGSRPDTALLVIDVQEDFTRNGPKPYPEVERTRAIERINRNILESRQAGEDVILIRHVFRHWPAILAVKLLMGGVGTPGRKGLDFDPDLQAGDAPVFEKTIGDAFFNPELEAYLADRNIGHLRLTGLDACQCVQFTAKGAMNRGYSVEVIEPSLLTATPEKWPAVKTSLTDLGAVVHSA